MRHNKYLLLFCLALFFLPSGVAASGNPLGLNKNQPYGILTTGYVTPHISWANPYYKGKVRVLVLAPEWSQRETVELAQRLSLDFTAWMTSNFYQVVSPRSSDRAFAFFQPPPGLVYRLLGEDLKKNYDVIIIGKLDWQMLPGKQRFELLKKVAEGTGLIYIDPPENNKELNIVFKGEPIPEGVDFITDNLPLSSLPRFKKIKREDLVKTTTFGKGRVVILNYQDSPPPKNKWAQAAWPCLTPAGNGADPKSGFSLLSTLPKVGLVSYEYYQALVAKAVLWAGKKEPETQIKGIGLAGDIHWPVAGKKAVIELKNLLPGALIRAAVRDGKEYGQVYALGRKKAGKETTFSLPNLPAGNYFLDIWVLTSDGQQIINWGSKGFSVISDFKFGKITLAKNSFDRGEAIAGKVKIPRLLRKNEKIIISLWDNDNREIESKELKPAATSVPFQFAPREPLTILHRVQVKLLRNNKEVCEAKIVFPVRAKLRGDDFNSVVWANAPNRFITHLMLRKLSAVDEADVIDLPFRGSTAVRNIARANLMVLPYTARFGVFSGKDNIIKRKGLYGPMTSPETLEAVKKWGSKESEIFGPYGPFGWTQGDESCYSKNPNIDWSPTSLAAFRDYLKSVYPDLSALNREWGTRFKKWDEVMPLTFKEAKKTGSYARWIEHRLSSDRIFAQFYRKTGEALSSHDPGARVGFDGAQGQNFPNSGLDWWLLSKHLGILQSYMGNSGNMEIFRSFAKSSQIRGMWYGTYGLTWQMGPNTVPFSDFFPWYSLFHQLNTTWFWIMGNPGPLSGYAPDLTSLPFFAARTESLKKIKSGIGKLLLAGSRANDKIAIYYSEVSRIADSLFATNEGDWSKGYSESLVDFNKALEDNGFQYDYLSSEQVANGDLIKKGFKVFIMPHSRAISKMEAGRIRRFVKKGGVVIADIIPGVLDGHGTPEKRSLLADLFPGNKPGTVTRVGRGKTILVGDLLKGYGKAHMSEHGWKELKGRWKGLGDLLKKYANIRPAVKVIPVGAEMPPTEITRIKCGKIEFVGLLREYFLYDNAPYGATVVFPYKSYVYNVLKGKYLGFTDRVKTEISYKAKLYALSPYRVEGLQLTLSAQRIKPGEVTSLQIEVETKGNVEPSNHAFRLEIFKSDGKELRYYAQNIISDSSGVGAAKVRWALNEVPGKYRVRVRDVMSGISAQKTVIIE